MIDLQPILSAHIEETIKSIARLQADHRNNAPSFQQAIERVTSFIGRSTFVAGMTVAVIFWVGGNIFAAS